MSIATGQNGQLNRPQPAKRGSARAPWLAPVCLCGLALAASAPANTAATNTNNGPAILAKDISFRNEMQRAIDRGLLWLKTNQAPEGYWSTPDQTALTAMALLAFQGDPSGKQTGTNGQTLAKGYRFLLDAVRPDGGIHKGNLVNYNTALSLLALLAANQADYEPIIIKARQFLIGLQIDFGEKGKIDTPYDGGVGYGTSYDHSDLSNTLQALEALYYSRRLAEDKNLAGLRDLDWKAAVHFIQSCQNLPEYNPEKWVSDDPKERGGFIYYPGESKAGPETNSATGRVSLRSYGSISYAGLLSYSYAELTRDDPRVQAVLNWLRSNYTLEENPGMGPQGLFYYYHAMAKALSAYNVDHLALADGHQVDWRRELATRLINLQQKDGSWINDAHGRWWEKDPVLVTCYAVLTMERMLRGP